MALSERLNTPISTAELERRWQAVRAAMARDKIDVLLMQNNNDHMGGYVRYFTDMPATNGYPNTVVFPRDDEMTVVCQGPFGGGETTAQGDADLARRQAGAHHAELRLGALHQGLRPRARGQGAQAVRQRAPSAMSAPIRCRLRCSTIIKRAFPKAQFRRRHRAGRQDQGDQERGGDGAGQARGAMQDGAMRAAFAAVKPGMRDIEVAAVAQHYSLCHGSENGIYLCASMPLGKPSKFANRHLQNRVIQEGDQIALLVEDNGPGGMYTELGRSCVVGPRCRRR